jgi:hypothetical protein
VANKEVTESNVTITADTAQNLAGKTVTVTTDVATVTLDTKVVDDVAKASTSADGTKSNVTLTVVDTTESNKANTDSSDDGNTTDNSKLVSSVEVKLTDENGDSVAAELSGEVTITMDIPEGVNISENGTVYIYRRVNGVAVEPVEATVKNGQIVFSTSIMGEYGLYETPVDEEVLSENTTNEHPDEDNDKVCDVCGQVIGAYIYSHTLTLDGNIGVNYYMYLTSDVAACRDSYMEFVVDGDTYKVTVNEAQKSGNYYVFTCATYAPEMTDTITATFHLVKNGQDVAVSKKDYSYSVAQYAANVKAKYAAGDTRYSAKLIALIDAMMNYGGKTQAVYSHSTNNMADAGIAMSQYEYTYDLTNRRDGKYERGSINGLTYKGAVVSMNAKATVRFYFEVDESLLTIKEVTGGYTIEGITAFLDSQSMIFHKGVGAYSKYYYLETEGIPASQLRGRRNLEIFDDNYTDDYEGYLEIKYGPMTYVLNKLNGKTQDEISSNKTLAMCQAMYYYYVAAADYIGVG